MIKISIRSPEKTIVPISDESLEISSLRKRLESIDLQEEKGNTISECILDTLIEEFMKIKEISLFYLRQKVSPNSGKKEFDCPYPKSPNKNDDVDAMDDEVKKYY